MQRHSVMEQNDWQAYRRGNDDGARERLIGRHIGLVRHFARRMASSAGSALSREELVSAGMLGLLNAVDTYDPDRGFRFSTFAAPRIRGAMLDELRRRDPAPRSVRRRQRKLAETENRLTLHLERLPLHGEVAEKLGVDPSTLWDWKQDVVRARSVSLEEGVGGGGDGDSLRLGEVLRADSWEDPEERVTARQEVARLYEEMDELDERERLVLRLYDLQEMKLREIAVILNVTESRVSQIRTRALGRLRERMGALRGMVAA